MPTQTTKFGLNKPLVNDATDQDLWGGYLNGDLDGIDSVLNAALSWQQSYHTASFSVAAPTAQSTSIGGARLLYLCDATSGNLTVSLPDVSTVPNGFTVAVKRYDATDNSLTVTTNNTQKIDGSSTISLPAQYQYVVMACDTAEWNIISQTAPSTVKVNVVAEQEFTTSGTYTPSAGMLYCVVEMVGGGGGGANFNSGQGGGGGGGAYNYGVLTAAQVGASQTVTVGSGGGGNGNGGSTSVGSLMSAGGGGAGNGSAGGSGGGGFLNGNRHIPGQPGGYALSGSSNASGVGGNSVFGFGGQATVNGGGSGSSGTGYGAGGSGANSSGSAGGGGGAPGVVYITEYCSQ